MSRILPFAGAAFIAAVLLAIPLETPATGFASGWGVSVLLEIDDTTSATNPCVAVDHEGNAVAVWEQNDEVWSSRYEVGVGWEIATRISAVGMVAYDAPQVAMDGEGNAIAIWTQHPVWGEASVFANRYVVGSGWEEAVAIEDNEGVYAHYPRLSMNHGGVAVAVWNQQSDLWSNRFIPGYGWGADFLVEACIPDSMTNTRSVAVDAQGNAIYAWAQYDIDGMHSNATSKRYDVQDGWETTVLLETDDEREFAFQIDVEVNPDGDAIAVWNQGPNDDYMNFSIFASRYIMGSGWQPAIPLGVEDADDESNPQVAMDAEGNAIVVWTRADFVAEHRNISACRFEVGSGWGDVTRLDVGDSYGRGDPVVSVDSNGNAFVVWSQSDDTSNAIWSSRYVVGSGWGTPMLVQSETGGAYSWTVGADEKGNAIAVWHCRDVAHYDVWSNRYEGPSEPSPPLSLQATAGDGYVNLTWQAPSLNGASAISGYKVYRGTSPSPSSLVEQIGPVLYYNDTGLTNGVTYYYRVIAFNTLAEGPPSSEVSAKPTGTSVAALVVQIDADPGSGQAPLEVSFTCSVTGGTGPYAYLWNFTDGGTSVLQNPTHTFDAAGSYTVKVKVTDSEGNFTEKTVQIEVSSGGSTSSLPIAVGGAIAAIVVVAVAVYIMMRRRGKTATRASPTEKPEPPPSS